MFLLIVYSSLPTVCVTEVNLLIAFLSVMIKYLQEDIQCPVASSCCFAHTLSTADSCEAPQCLLTSALLLMNRG